MPRLLLASAALALCAVPLTTVAAQTTDAAGGGVGTEFMVFEVETSEAAKERFLRGLALLDNFEYRRAADAFRRSLAFAPGRKLSLDGLARAEGG